jgi:hypothetical protein
LIDESSSLSSVDAGSSSLAASSVVEQSSSSSSSSSNAPASTHLIIQGNAVANALAGGKIVFTVGSQTFETAIDESLEYSVTLEVPHEDSDKPFVALRLVLAQMVGFSSQQFIHRPVNWQRWRWMVCWMQLNI